MKSGPGRGGWVAGCAVAAVVTTVVLVAPRPVVAGLAIGLALAAVAGAGAALPEPTPNIAVGVPWRALVLLGCGFGAAIAAPTGMAPGSGSGLLAAAATLGVTGGLIAAASISQRRPPTGPGTAGAPPAPYAVSELQSAGTSPPVPETLAVTALGIRWRCSYLELRLARSARTRVQLAELRRGYLDEMADRDPAGFAAWLAHDPHPAAGHPELYLNGHRPRREPPRPQRPGDLV